MEEIRKMAALLVGAVLHKTYVLERVIGTGGMGVVFAARHVRLPRRCAVKLLYRNVTHDDKAMARFRREAEICSGLGHDNIVEVNDFNFTADGTPYIVMEYLEGRSLASYLAKGERFSLPEIGEIIAQTAAGVSAAHAQGVIHRDLKPQNLFLTQRRGEFNVKVLDFGISKVVGSDSIATGEHVVLGTPWYMAPEQAEGRIANVDGRTDIFALGAILYELLTGTQPFTGQSIPTVLFHIVHTPPADARTLNPEVSAELAAVVDKALAKKSDDRYARIEQLGEAVVAETGRRSPRDLSGLRPVPTPPPWSTDDWRTGPPTPELDSELGSEPGSEPGSDPSITLPPTPPENAEAAMRAHRMLAAISGNRPGLAMNGASLSQQELVALGPPLGGFAPTAEQPRPLALDDTRSDGVPGEDVALFNAASQPVLDAASPELEPLAQTTNRQAVGEVAPRQPHRRSFWAAIAVLAISTAVVVLLLVFRRGSGPPVAAVGQQSAPASGSGVNGSATLRPDAGRAAAALAATRSSASSGATKTHPKRVSATVAPRRTHRRRRRPTRHRQRRPQRQAQGMLYVLCHPDARVLVDGKLVGVTPVRRKFAAGKHAVRIERLGYRPHAAVVRVLEGKRVVVETQLVRIPSASTSPAKTPHVPKRAARRPSVDGAKVIARIRLPKTVRVNASQSGRCPSVHARAVCAAVEQVANRALRSSAASGATRPLLRYVCKHAPSERLDLYPRAMAYLIANVVLKGRRNVGAQLLQAHRSGLLAILTRRGWRPY